MKRPQTLPLCVAGLGFGLGLAIGCGGTSETQADSDSDSGSSAASESESTAIVTTSQSETSLESSSQTTAGDSSAMDDSDSLGSSDSGSSATTASESLDSGDDSSDTTGASDTSDSESDAESGEIVATIESYRFQYDLRTRELRSTVSSAVASPGGNCYQLDCEPEVADTSWNASMPDSTAQKDGTLHICGPSVSGGTQLEVSALAEVEEKTYLQDPQGNWLDVGYTEKADLSGGTFTYLMTWIGGCKHFGPCESRPDRLAEFHYEIEHDKGQVVVCPGRLTAGETRTTCDLDRETGSSLAPTYTGIMIASNPAWERTEFARAAGTDLVFYEAPGGKIQSALSKDNVADFFEWITGLVGPYPYGDELRFVSGPTFWLGLEHPGNIVLQEKLNEVSGAYTDSPMHILMHETAHQWSGDRTTIASAQDFAWKEATAEYLSYLYEEERGESPQAARTREFWEQLAHGAQHYPRPTDTPELEPQEFYGDAYGAGPIVMYLQLEDLLGKDKVRKALVSFLKDEGVRSVADLRDELEEASGEDLDDYFDAWVFGKGVPTWPTFAVKTSSAGTGKTRVEVTQSSADKKLRGCAVQVEVTTSEGTQKAIVDFGLSPQSATASAEIALGGTVTSTRVDPDHRVLNLEKRRTSYALPKGFHFGF